MHQILMRRAQNFSTPEIDTALLEWFRCLKSTVPNEWSFSSRKSICIVEKLKVRNLLGCLKPVFLDLNWIDRWKKRHNITSRQISGESQSADHAGADIWISTQLKLIREEFEDKDIFNADETGLFWKMTPDKKRFPYSLLERVSAPTVSEAS